MASASLIEWTDATWNPITGCSVLTAGCARCYAMTLAGGRMKSHPSRAGLTVETSVGPVWTGEVRFNEAWLCEPLGWGKPRRIFVCAHGDLFHESVPDAWIDRVFAVMALRPDHIFQVLTKRAARMRAYVTDPETPGRIFAALAGVAPQRTDTAWQHWISGQRLQLAAERLAAWPLRNVWLGVSAEDQETANFRLVELLQTPAAIRYLSAEPLLAPMDVAWAVSHPLDIAAGFLKRGHFSPGLETLRPLDQVIVGGESGRRARPSAHPVWVRAIRDACHRGNVTAFFFKQWGEWAPVCAIEDTDEYYEPAREDRPEAPRLCKVETEVLQVDGSCGDEFDCRPGAMMVMKIGKKRAGRLLDGIEWSEQPRAAEALAA